VCRGFHHSISEIAAELDHAGSPGGALTSATG